MGARGPAPPLPRSARALGRDCDRVHPRPARSAAGCGALRGPGRSLWGARHWPPLSGASHPEDPGPGCPHAESSQARPVQPVSRPGTHGRGWPLALPSLVSGVPPLPPLGSPFLGHLVPPSEARQSPQPRCTPGLQSRSCVPTPTARTLGPRRRHPPGALLPLCGGGCDNRASGPQRAQGPRSLSHVALFILERTVICLNEFSSTGGETEARRG